MSRVQIYKLNAASVVVTDFAELPGEILSNDTVDYHKPPVVPDDLQTLFAHLSKGEQPAKLIVCENNTTPISHANQNGWSMCQSTPPVRRRLDDKRTTAFLAPI